MDLDRLISYASDLVTFWGLRVLGAVALLVIGWLFARWLRRSVRLGLERTHVDRTLVPFLSGLAFYVLVALVAVAVLGLFGIPVASFVALAGAIGLAIGLAFQGTLSNFAAGVMLLVFRPFSSGDFVQIADTAGTVGEITIFTTTLDTPDNVHIVVPNSSIWGQIIKNYATNPTRRLDLVVGISYDDDVRKAIETVRRVLAADVRVLSEPEPVVVVGNLGDSSVDLFVRPWVKKDDYWALKWDLLERFKAELEAAGCSIPFPQRDVHVFEEKKEGAAA